MTTAALLTTFGADLVVDEVSLSEPARDEVRVRTVASGVCHTDRSIQLGARTVPLPTVLGHEVAGVVTDVGDNVTGARVGDHVIACAAAFCGRCKWCVRGEQQHCTSKGYERGIGSPPRMMYAGSAADPFCGLGGFASELLVHQQALVVIPREMPLDRAALIGCAVMTGGGVIRHRAQVQMGDTVVVIGSGGVGLTVVQMARVAGATRVIAVDINPHKREVALAMGATDFVDASAGNAVDTVLDLTGGGARHVIEVVGRPETIAQGYSMLETRGTLTVVGVAKPGTQVAFDVNDMLLSEKRVQGCRSGSTKFTLDLPLYCQQYLAGQLDLDSLISHRIRLEDVNNAMDELDGSDGVRSVIVFDDGLVG